MSSPATLPASSTDTADRKDQRMTALHWRVFLLSGLVAFFDGFDTQALGPAVSTIAATLQVDPAGFGAVFSASQVGFLLGAMLFSTQGDRHGRKRMLIITTTLFAICSLATAMASSLEYMIAVRFLAGIGLGGAAPNFISLVSEYSPPAHRPRIVTLLWAAVPIGGMAGSFGSAFTLPLWGWPAIFVIGGIMPLLLVPVLMRFMPESCEVGAVTRQNREAATISETFTGDGRLMATVWLWLASWMTWTTLIVISSWTPLLLQRLGWSSSGSASVLGAINAGGVIGTLIIGAMLVRVSAIRAYLVTLLATGAATVLLGSASDNAVVVVLAAIATGFFASSAGGLLLSVSSGIYPAKVRSTGVGWTLGFGRIGAVLGPMMGGVLLVNAWDTTQIYYLISVLPLLAALFVWLLSRTQVVRTAVAARLAPQT